MSEITLRGNDGTELFGRQWLPEGEVRGEFVALHGYAEHSGRQAEIAEVATGLGLRVWAYDHRGHGRSPGLPGFVADFDQIVADAAAVIAQVIGQAGGKPIFLYGHSMGGLVLARYAQTFPVDARGLIFSSPLLALNESVSPVLVVLAPYVATLFPSLPVLKLETAALSRDPAVVKAYEEDPLVYLGPIRARTGHALNEAVKRARADFSRIAAPVLVWHGEADRLAPFTGGRDLYEQAGSKDKTFRAWPGGYHEPLHDLCRDEAKSLAREWIAARLQQ